ncbi:hypothetical protein LA303_08930 [Candidatus Sulfidibacterium hydrothermale]|uniref:hypothetical protein n=1 Tax=Candidatus Sulfidibacterium hydrothermale TaxID=2875962 RepID=UPI001F0A1030|nr:hypothetical protein [Candidatus Sulfidibacterium hydrothermale]UBM61539.1 hypothetical protein LA303_08930 [Candidatus Sulfidibacterium hydrothermale]
MRKTIRIIIILAAVLQLVGGFFGIYVFYKSSSNTGYHLFEALLSVIPIILLNLLGGITLLWIKTPKGVIVSGVNYLTQLFQFHFFGFYYFNVSGPYVGVGFVKKLGHSFAFWWDKAQFITYDLIRADGNMKLSYLAINLIALLLIFTIVLEYKYRKEDLVK